MKRFTKRKTKVPKRSLYLAEHPEEEKDKYRIYYLENGEWEWEDDGLHYEYKSAATSDAKAFANGRKWKIVKSGV